MALSKAKVREILSKAGVDAEHMQDALTEILDGNIASIEAVKEERDRYKEESEKLSALQKELEAIKSNENKSPYKAKYEAISEQFEALKKDFDQYKADQTAKETKAAKEKAVRSYFESKKIVGDNLVIAMRGAKDEIDAVELNEDGKISDTKVLDDLVNGDYSRLVVTTQTMGANVSNPPANTGGTKKTREEIDAIKDTKARQIAMYENKELYI